VPGEAALFFAIVLDSAFETIPFFWSIGQDMGE
jgi:hypothetical protein